MTDLPAFLAHVGVLEHVIDYQAPPAQPRPRKIESGHELVEILTDGKVDFPVGDKLHTFGRGTMFWHQGGDSTIHLNHEDSPYRCVVLAFAVEGAPAWAPPRVCRWTDADEALRFAALMREVESDPLAKEFHGLHAYSRLILEARRAARHDLLTDPWPPALGRAVAFIEDHFAEPVGLDEVAAWAGISLPHLHGLFARHLKQSPYRMLLDLRLRRARTLLMETEAPLKQVAADTGFSSPQYFCRSFSRHWGLSPGLFRRRYGVREARVTGSPVR